ncbi:S9 family peptidase [Kordiimonas gwangyangensis]|uniref:S9 family peptidase n=1 Tax=Kordiimonas gwangyangensis TaxID=288022 RepID=UPI00036B1A7B|nr:prolyl oligopeptidase family serine peptidase [Kordiimonas gwangyangensis]
MFKFKNLLAVPAMLALSIVTASTGVAGADNEPAADTQTIYQVGDFTGDWSVSGMKLSPNGKRLLFTQVVNGELQLMAVDILPTELRALTVIPFDNDSIPINLRWATDDRIVFTLRRKARVVRTKYYAWSEVLMSMNADGSDVQLLRTDGGGSGNLKHIDNADVVSLLRDDPDHILVGKSRRRNWVQEFYDGAIDDVYKLNIKTGDLSLYMKGPKISHFKFHDWYADQKGHIRFGYGYDRKGNSVMIIRGRGDEDWKVLNDNELFEEGKFLPLQFGAGDNEFYVLSSLATGRMAVYRFDIATGTLGDLVFAHDRVDVTGIIYSFDKGKVVAAEYNEGGPKLHYLDEEYGKLRSLLARALKTGFSLWSTSDDDKNMIVLKGDAQDAGTYYHFDAAAKKLNFLGARIPKLDPAQMAKMESVSYETRDGLTIDAVLTKPRLSKGEPLPFIVLPHTHPDGRDSVSWDRTAQFLANRGYGVFQPNYRGSSGFGQRFRALGRGEWGRDMQNDLVDGVEWMIENGHAQAGRICIMGRGYAGYAALMGVARDGNLFACAISRDAPVDIPAMLKAERSLDEDDERYQEVAGDLKKNELESISPADLVENINSPVLIYHREDAHYEVQHVRRFVKSLAKAKKSFDYLEVEEAEGANLYDANDDDERFLALVEAWLLKVNPTPLLKEANEAGKVARMQKTTESRR